jgi:hypothetical protein
MSIKNSVVFKTENTTDHDLNDVTDSLAQQLIVWQSAERTQTLETSSTEMK